MHNYIFALKCKSFCDVYTRTKPFSCKLLSKLGLALDDHVPDPLAELEPAGAEPRRPAQIGPQ